MKSSNEPKHPAGPPMTLGNIWALGVQRLSSSEAGKALIFSRVRE
jgi:hypothetical protein